MTHLKYVALLCTLLCAGCYGSVMQKRIDDCPLYGKALLGAMFGRIDPQTLERSWDTAIDGCATITSMARQQAGAH